jgi:hypothetical protein
MKQTAVIAAVVAGAFTLQPMALAATVELRAAVIKGNGDIKPAARQDFTLYPDAGIYTESQFRAVARAAKLDAPDGAKYVSTRLLHDDLVKETKVDKDGFEKAFSDWKVNVDLAAYKKSNRKMRTIKTNLDGKASVALEPGHWVISGEYKDGFANLHWLHKFEVKGKRIEIELSNDNSGVNYFSPNAPDIGKSGLEVTEAGQRYASAARLDLVSAKTAIAQKNGQALLTSLGLGLVAPGGLLAAGVKEAPLIAGSYLVFLPIFMIISPFYKEQSPLTGEYESYNVETMKTLEKLISSSDVELVSAIKSGQPLFDKAITVKIQK